MKKTPWILLALGTVGFLDSVYLSIIHFTNNSIICDGTNACDLVLTSPYSSFAGIPLALYGVIFYAYIIIVSNLMLDKIKNGSNLSPKLITPVAFLGFSFSLYFTYLQAFIINSYCTFCLISAGTATLIFITALLNCFYNFKKNNEITKNFE